MEVVSNEWNCVKFSSNSSKKFALKLRALKCRLKGWNKHLGSSLKGFMEECKKEIRVLDLLEEERPLSSLEISEKVSLKRDFMESALKEETF